LERASVLLPRSWSQRITTDFVPWRLPERRRSPGRCDRRASIPAAAISTSRAARPSTVSTTSAGQGRVKISRTLLKWSRR